jgi:hypothetical protein
VQHAHQKGIIHRDLKPSNILVESHDGKPVPKVIDFGLAKATSGLQLSEQSLHTESGAVLGTPLYMAPEQASFNAIDVDTRADVYALGVILYELLTGTTPITRETIKRASFDEMLRLIREQEAPTPSSRLSSSDAAPNIAANLQTEPQKLSRFVKGDLDWIVMKALAKERERRYETADGFARDIERFLNHEPVLAGPPTAGYRIRKFIRRNRGPVIAASLVFLALVAGVISTTIGLVRAAQAAEQERLAKIEAETRRQEAEAATEKERLAKVGAEEQRQQAVAAAEKERLAKEAEMHARKYAEAIATFVKEDFLALTSLEGQDRFSGTGLDRNSTLLDLLNRAAAKLPERKDLDPRIEAELSWIIGVNYRGAGEADKGVPFLERAVALRRQLLGAEHEDTLIANEQLGDVLRRRRAFWYCFRSGSGNASAGTSSGGDEDGSATSRRNRATTATDPSGNIVWLPILLVGGAVLITGTSVAVNSGLPEHIGNNHPQWAGSSSDFFARWAHRVGRNTLSNWVYLPDGSVEAVTTWGSLRYSSVSFGQPSHTSTYWQRIIPGRTGMLIGRCNLYLLVYGEGGFDGIVVIYSGIRTIYD